MEVSGEGIVSA